METVGAKVKKRHIISTFAVGGILVAVSQFSGSSLSVQLLFPNSNQFVLFAGEDLKLERGTQISSGDLGSNKSIAIGKDAIINGNLFADRIDIDKNSTINGNASYNKLQLHQDAQILGTTTTPVSLPIVNLPTVADFQIGTQDFRFEGATSTLAAGSYHNVVIEKDSRLVLSGGIYNLRKLELKENATLSYSSTTTLNIQFKLRGHDWVSILPGLNQKPDDLQVNYLGIKLSGSVRKKNQ